MGGAAPLRFSLTAIRQMLVTDVVDPSGHKVFGRKTGPTRLGSQTSYPGLACHDPAQLTIP